MAFKRALVVDDSKSARVALKRLLEAQDLAVELAESGEEALDFLKHHMVDVIFMDHTMPGMDGLEAVTAIKSNPRTATIPVMMYTTKEGEVYVGQARALGAVGVLPKQVQPGVLFDMLLKLGLVADRRDGRARPPDTSAAAYVPGPVESFDAADRALDQQALGMSVQTLVTRILEDQHSELRSDILKSHRSFARQVAAELLQQQQSNLDQTQEPVAGAGQHEPPAAERSGSKALAFGLALALAVLGAFAWQVRGERDALRDDLARLAVTAEQSSAGATARTASLVANLSAARDQDQARYLELLNTLAWAMNQTGSVPFADKALNDTRAEQLRELLSQLSAVDFRGTVLVESHLGEFCLVSDEVGIYRLAEPILPVESCALVGHPLDDSSFVNERETASFERFVAESPLAELPGVDLRIVAHDRIDSVPLEPFPPDIEAAGEWNRIAQRNNRVEYSLIPDL